MTDVSAKELPTKAMNLEDLQEVLQMYNEVTQRLEVSHARLQAEVARLTEQLEEKNRELEMKKRLAALGEMAAGIAHEIRNPLGGIQLYASTLAAEVTDRPGAVALVRKISDGVKGLNALVSDMLSFTKDMSLAKREEELAEIVQGAVELATPSLLARRVEVRVREEVGKLRVTVDAKLLRQVLLNLLLNAAEAMGEGAEKPGARSQEPENAIVIGARRLRKRVEITVEDNGPGFGEGTAEKIFDPFFTTKHTGTGLGLAIVHRIVEAHGGNIRAENCETRGARFVITL